MTSRREHWAAAAAAATAVALLCACAGLTQAKENATAGGNATLTGPWAGVKPNISAPVTARAFRFGTKDEAVTLANNSCGFGPLTSPYIAGVSPDSPLANLRPQSGCGTCLQVVCEQDSPVCSPTASGGPLTADSPPFDPSAAASNTLAGSASAPGGLLLSVSDTCDTCQPLELNLHATAWEALLSPEAVASGIGIYNVTYRVVDCPTFGRNMSVYVDEYRASAGGWLRLALRDVAGPGLAQVALAHCPRPNRTTDGTENPTPSTIGNDTSNATQSANIQIQGGPSATDANRQGGIGGGGRQGGVAASGGLSPACSGTLRGPYWRLMENTAGAQWEFSGLPRLPLDLRVTAVDGQEIIVWNAITNTSSPVLLPTQAQFSPTPLGQGEEGADTAAGSA